MALVHKAFKLFKPEDEIVYVDIGAYVGVVVGQCADTFPNAKILAVEPCPTNFDVLKGRFADDDRVILDNCAIGSDNKQRTLYCTSVKGLKGSSESNTFHGKVLEYKKKTKHRITNIKPMKVDVVTLDHLLARHGIKHIDILKFNCEGGEYEVFEAKTLEWLSKTKYISIDMHSDNPFYHTKKYVEKRKNMYRTMQKHGFERILGSHKMRSEEDVSMLLERTGR